MEAYRKLCTAFYDLAMPEPHENSMALYRPIAQKVNGPVLEPMCGSGRYLIPMLELGIDIDGTDASEHMLASCRQRCAERGVKADLSHQLLQQLDLPRKYGFVLIPAGSIGLITNLNEVRESLNRIYAHLLPGGLFSVEIETLNSRPATSDLWKGRWVERSDGAKIVLSELDQWDEENGINRSLNRYELFEDGVLVATELECIEVRYYELGAFQSMLEDAGFQHVTAYNRYTHDKATSEDTAIVIECSRS